MEKLILNNIQTLPYDVQEALNRLRVNFGFCGKDYKKIMITSSTPNEGKSFVSLQLWKMLADAGSNVVFVDADLRKSVVRNQYRISLENGSKYSGLTQFLAGMCSANDVLYSTNIEHGYFVPIANNMSNPSILLENGKLEFLLNALANEFDYVIVDTPPLVDVSDGNIIASYCDGAILVVRGGVTPRKLISSSIQQLELTNCKLLGTVLNRVELSKNPYYYRYSNYGYGYGYGYGNDSKKSK